LAAKDKKSQIPIKNNHGASAMEIVLWFSVVVAVIIIMGWFFLTMNYSKPVFDNTKNDLFSLQSLVEEACASYTYSINYNPVTETGTLTYSNQKLCIETGGIEVCNTLLCQKVTPNEIDLSKASKLLVGKKKDANVIISIS
jgi:nitrogen fixation protein FixH